MVDKVQDQEKKQGNSTEKAEADAFISKSLKTYYDTIVEEGTPDYLLDLLERLDAAERAAAKK